MVARVLIVDDEPNIREVIRFALERAGFLTATARNGVEAVQSFRRGGVDLLVLDVGMPEMDGLEVCRQIRRISEVPILFLSARDEEIDRVLGLEMGGDDYLTKPFSPRELVARVNAILKRVAQRGERGGGVLTAGALKLDADRHAVHFADRPVALTALEFAILKTFMERPDRLLSRQQLIDLAYGPSTHLSDRTVDSHIRNIRAKLAEAGCPGVIATVHGVGFRLALEPGGS